MKQLELIEKPKPDAWNEAFNAVHGPERAAVNGKPHGSIQWKGTKVCMDVTCGCGYDEHIDADFLYSWVCPECKTIYAVSDQVPFIPITKEQANTLRYSTEPFPDPPLCSEQDIHAAGVPNLEDTIANPGPLNRAEYDYLCEWLGKLGYSDAAQAYPVLRQMRNSYHD